MVHMVHPWMAEENVFQSWVPCWGFHSEAVLFLPYVESFLAGFGFERKAGSAQSPRPLWQVQFTWAPLLGCPLRMGQQIKTLSQYGGREQLVEWCVKKERCFCCEWLIYWARDTKSCMSEGTAANTCLGAAQFLQINICDQKIAMNPGFLQQLFSVDLSPSLSCPCAVTAGRSMPAGTRDLGHCGSHRLSRDRGCQPAALHGSIHHAGHGGTALPAGLPGLLRGHPWEQMPPALCKCSCHFCWPLLASCRDDWVDDAEISTGMGVCCYSHYSFQW